MDLLINAANLLFVLNTFTKDVLRLRLVSVVAISCLALGFWSQPEPMLNVVAWNLFFLALNIVQIVRLLRARRGPGAETRCTRVSRPDGPWAALVAGAAGRPLVTLAADAP